MNCQDNPHLGLLKLSPPHALIKLVTLIPQDKSANKLPRQGGPNFDNLHGELGLASHRSNKTN